MNKALTFIISDAIGKYFNENLMPFSGREHHKAFMMTEDLELVYGSGYWTKHKACLYEFIPCPVGE